jgi:hypothetical protein
VPGSFYRVVAPATRVREGAAVSIGMVGWVAGGMALAVAVVGSLRLVRGSGPGRCAVGAEVVMALCMAVMALPATAGMFMSGSRWSAGLFALAGAGCLAVAVREAAGGRWRRGGGWFHHAVGWAAMVCMVLAVGAGKHTTEHTAMGAAAPSVWSAACAVLALYFLLSMAVALWRQVGTDAPAGGWEVPLGRIAMGGVTAVMLVVMM